MVAAYIMPHSEIIVFPRCLQQVVSHFCPAQRVLTKSASPLTKQQLSTFKNDLKCLLQPQQRPPTLLSMLDVKIHEHELRVSHTIVLHVFIPCTSRISSVGNKFSTHSRKDLAIYNPKRRSTFALSLSTTGQVCLASATLGYPSSASVSSRTESGEAPDQTPTRSRFLRTVTVGLLHILQHGCHNGMYLLTVTFSIHCLDNSYILRRTWYNNLLNKSTASCHITRPSLPISPPLLPPPP